jgi:hypothetical protein
VAMPEAPVDVSRSSPSRPWSSPSRPRPCGRALAPAVGRRGTFGRPSVRPRGPGRHGRLGYPDRRGGAGRNGRASPRRRPRTPGARRPSLEAQAGLVFAGSAPGDPLGGHFRRTHRRNAVTHLENS